MSGSSSRTNATSKGKMKGLLPKFKGLKMTSAGDALQGAAVRLWGLKENLHINDQGYLDLIDKVEVLTDGILKPSAKGKANSAQDDKELIMLANVVDEISSWTEAVQKSGTARDAAGSDENSKKLVRYNNMLNNIYSRVQMGATLDIRRTLNELHRSQDAPSPSRPIPNDVPLTDVPPNPTYVYGRDRQRKSAREALLKLAHIAVLGGGGMGKTTFAVALLHDDAIVEKFGRHRIFVNCDGVTTADGIVTVMHKLLGVSTQDGITSLQSLVLYVKSLEPCVLLVLDNLESAWDTLEREAVESLLTNLCNIPPLALIITMRGNRSPNGQKWLSFPPLENLSLEDSRNLFIEVSDSVDDKLDELLGLLDGLPLAVTLMASLGKNTTGITPSKLLQSYLSERTSLLDTGTKTRTSNLDVSIMVSINCRTMLDNPDALELLKLLSLLPDGVRDEHLRSTFPEMARCDGVARILRTVALAAYSDGTTRVLAPIRDFMRARYPPSGSHLLAMREHFIQLALSSDKYPDVPPSVVETLSTQMANLQSVMTDAIESHADPRILLEALYHLGWFSYSAHVGDCTLVLRRAVSIYRVRLEDTVPSGESTSSQDTIIRGRPQLPNNDRESTVATPTEESATANVDHNHRVIDCAYLLGIILEQHYRYAEEIEILQEAKSAYMNVEEWTGVARCLESLGNILRMQNMNDQAASLLSEAKAAYTKLGNRHGVAECLWKLGNILRLQSQYKQAAGLLNEAKEVYSDIGNRPGVAQCLWSLGDILAMQGQYEQAAGLLNQAKEVYSDIGDRLGVAQCLKSLGDILRMQDQYEQAAGLLNEAKEAYTDMGNRLGVVQCLWSLGDILAMQGQYEQAAGLLNQAKEVYSDIGDRLGVAQYLRSLGDILRMQGQYEQAAGLLNQAKEVYSDIGDRLGVAQCLRSLGDILRMQDQYEQAAGLLSESKTIYKDIGDQYGLAWCAFRLGEVRRAQGRLDEARALFADAKSLFEGLKLSRQTDWCQEELDTLSQVQEAPQKDARRRRLRRPDWLRLPGKGSGR